MVRVHTGLAGALGDPARAQRVDDLVDPRMFVYRMVTAAMTQPDEVLAEMERLQIPNSYVHENKFFVGQGAELSPGP